MPHLAEVLQDFAKNCPDPWTTYSVDECSTPEAIDRIPKASLGYSKSRDEFCLLIDGEWKQIKELVKDKKFATAD